MNIFKKKSLDEMNEIETMELKDKARKYDEMVEVLSSCKDIMGYDEYKHWFDFFLMFDNAKVAKIRAMNMVALTKAPTEDNSKYKEKYDKLQDRLNKLEDVYKPDEDAGALLGTIHALRSTINRLNLEIDAMKHMLDRLDGEK